MIETSENVRVLRLAVIACREQLTAAERELRLALEAESSFKVNDVVEAKLRGGPWVPAIIRSVKPQSWGGVWCTVSTCNKDGNWSTVERNAFESVRVPGGPPDPVRVNEAVTWSGYEITPDML